MRLNEPGQYPDRRLLDRLTGFRSRWVIGTIGPHVFSIAGTYRFDRDGRGDEH
jgi:hypothetical protein